MQQLIGPRLFPNQTLRKWIMHLAVAPSSWQDVAFRSAKAAIFRGAKGDIAAVIA
jgi:hypothetical protein